MLLGGRWTRDDAAARNRDGRFVRQDTAFRDQIRADGTTAFPPEAGRYHLYVSYACPWAHRTLILRALKGLEAAISVSAVAPLMGDDGWEFSPNPDPICGARTLYQLYQRARPDYSGRVTVPVLWDLATENLVNNESADIVRMLNAEFAGIARCDTDFYPTPLRPQIDAVNDLVYHAVNNGVYRCGFATTQEAYAEAFHVLFAALDQLEARLTWQRYLVGDQPTEADWRLFTTLVRFDAVYYGHFKCNARRIADYPRLSAYLRDLYHVPGVADTVRLDQIALHYYGSHRSINPTGIVPLGPELDFTRPRRRAGAEESRGGDPPHPDGDSEGVYLGLSPEDFGL